MAEPPSDGTLVSLALGGSESAFAELFHRHREPLYRVVRGYVSDDDEALDITQESFIAAYRALGSFDPDRSLRAWLTHIALNKCRDWARKRKVRAFFTFALPLEQAGMVRAEQILPDRALDGKTALESLDRAVAALPAKLREPLLLCAVENYSMPEVAQILNVSVKAVEMRVYHARARLKQAITLQNTPQTKISR